MKTNIKKNYKQSDFNWYALFILSLTSIITGIYRDGFASLFPFLKQDFQLTKAQLGLHSTFYYFAAALFAVYTGRVVDLKGPKRSLIFSCLTMGIFYILHSIVPDFSIILLMAALTGASASFNMPSVNKSVVEIFSEKQRSTALGLQSMAFPIGGLLGAIVLLFLEIYLGGEKQCLYLV